MKYSLSRRSFVRTSIAIGLSQSLIGCSESEQNAQILFLENSIPLQLISDFKQKIKTQTKVDFKPQTQLVQIFNSLLKLQTANATKDQGNLITQIFNKSMVSPKLATLGDFWLTKAIQQNLIQPLAVKDLTSWEKLPTSWQSIGQRDMEGKLSPDGVIWGAPYRWGTTVIAYQSKKLNELDITIEDWQDLWQPKLRDRISLLDSPREIIGLTLKKMGYSYNLDNLDSVTNLESELQKLNQQAKLYSSNRYLEPLILEDTWAAVGWSTDIIPLTKRYPEIKFVIPTSGSALWADLWVQPKISDHNDPKNNSSINAKFIEEWIDFCWQPKAAKQISLFTNGISPILSSWKATEIPKTLQDSPLLHDYEQVSQNSEFLLPLNPKTSRQYEDLWLKLRPIKTQARQVKPETFG